MSHQVAATFLRAVASAIATKHEDAMTAAQRRVDVGEAEADQVHGTPAISVKSRLVKYYSIWPFHQHFNVIFFKGMVWKLMKSSWAFQVIIAARLCFRCYRNKFPQKHPFIFGHFSNFQWSLEPSAISKILYTK